MLKKLVNWIKASKGVGTAKGKLIDYREAHRLQYGFLKGLAIFGPRKLARNMNVLHMDPEQWEDSEGQYIDTMMVTGYASKYIVLVHMGGLEVARYAILGA